jgi:flagellar basal body-associated protein FliL
MRLMIFWNKNKEIGRLLMEAKIKMMQREKALEQKLEKENKLIRKMILLFLKNQKLKMNRLLNLQEEKVLKKFLKLIKKRLKVLQS